IDSSKSIDQVYADIIKGIEPVLESKNSCKVMAKDVVRTRRYISKFYSMKTQLQTVSLRLQTLRSNQQMAEAMKGATKAMSLMSRQLNLPQIQRILQDFEKESSMMDMKEEMMGDGIRYGGACEGLAL
ncbi:Snf7-domain-containing protein, partial [Leucosporidium creatinivorum]